MRRVQKQGEEAQKFFDDHVELVNVPPKVDAKPSAEPAAKGAPAQSLEDFLTRVSTTFLKLDADAEFDAIQRALTLGVPGSRADRGTIADALEEAEDVARRAHLLFCACEASRAASNVDRRVTRASFWQRAKDGAIAHAAASGGKAPTKEDIQAWLDASLSDEVRNLEVEEANSDAAVAHLKQLAVLCRDRADTLRTMIRGVV